MSTIAVVGTGYVGLTTAACLAHLGHSVVAADVDRAKVSLLQDGTVPILEDGLEYLVRGGLEAGRLRFTDDVEAAVDSQEFVFLCLPTPPRADGSAEVATLLDACRRVSPRLAPGCVVVTKSTVPVGSATEVVAAIGRSDVRVASNPEFLREGSAVRDCLYPDRIVIGADDPAASARVAALYRDVNAPVLETDPASAETIKYAANAFLATKVSFVNAVANLCRVIGADVEAVLNGMGHDRRIGLDHLRPGPGWGGSCFPKDTAALIHTAEQHGYDFRLLREVVAANDDQFNYVAELVARAALGGGADASAPSAGPAPPAGGDLSGDGSAGARPVGRPGRAAGGSGVTEGGSWGSGRLDADRGSLLAGRRVAVWGLTFKAGTDDLRGSPAIAIVSRLTRAGATVAAYDPTRPGPDREPFTGLALAVCDDLYAPCEGAHCLAVLTEWDEFARANLTKAIDLMAHPAVVDARNVLDPIAVRAAGASYDGMGRA